MKNIKLNNKKLIPIINTCFASISLILTIVLNIYISSIGEKAPGDVLWIILISAEVLLFLSPLIYDLKIIHEISIFGALAPIILGIGYMILQIANSNNGVFGIFMYFIPQVIIYIIIFILELILYIKIYHKQN